MNPVLMVDACSKEEEEHPVTTSTLSGPHGHMWSRELYNTTFIVCPPILKFRPWKFS